MPGKRAQEAAAPTPMKQARLLIKSKASADASALSAPPFEGVRRLGRLHTRELSLC